MTFKIANAMSRDLVTTVKSVSHYNAVTCATTKSLKNKKQIEWSGCYLNVPCRNYTSNVELCGELSKVTTKDTSSNTLYQGWWQSCQQNSTLTRNRRKTTCIHRNTARCRDGRQYWMQEAYDIGHPHRCSSLVFGQSIIVLHLCKQ